MFYLIRKVILVCVLALLVAVGLLLYQNRHLLDPIIDWARVLRHRATDRGKIDGQLGGRVVGVLDGNTLIIREPNGLLYNIRMIGTQVPVSRAPEACKLLSGFALVQEVRVDITLVTTNRAGLGSIYVGGTNVASLLLAAGLATTDAKLLDAVPTAVQLELLRAERLAREKQVGVWAPAVPRR